MRVQKADPVKWWRNVPRFPGDHGEIMFGTALPQATHFPDPKHDAEYIIPEPFQDRYWRGGKSARIGESFAEITAQKEGPVNF